MSSSPKPLVLSAAEPFIFRITHINNVPHILEHGIQCRSSTSVNPGFVNIGSAELIDKRNKYPVPIQPYGTLSDYVPFYFTPHSIMLLNIKSGYGGVEKRRNEEIVIIASSLSDLNNQGVSFLFTDKHAYCQGAQFFNSLNDLNKIDWALLNKRDFSRDVNDPGKTLRYQAEALVHGRLEVPHMRGIACFTEAACEHVRSLVTAKGLSVPVACRPKWYF